MAEACSSKKQTDTEEILGAFKSLIEEKDRLTKAIGECVNRVKPITEPPDLKKDSADYGSGFIVDLRRIINDTRENNGDLEAINQVLQEII